MKIKTISHKLNSMLKSCRLCPHKCRVNRIEGQTGFCGATHMPVVSAAMPHHGEEPPLSGNRGSGTIFFSYCNMACLYCQNYQISQQHQGEKATIVELADMMLNLQHRGCHNINLVSPTIWIAQIVEALTLAKEKGLNLPVVYNTGGYENPEIIGMLDGIIDIYMPDMRYSNDDYAYRYSKIKNYSQYNRQSVINMYKQAGELQLNQQGVAVRGLLIRLLVLPDDLAGVKQTLEFIKKELSNKVALSIMAQYHPTFKACGYPEINRPVTAKEYNQVVNYAQQLGFELGYVQDYRRLPGEDDPFLPDFNQKDVFGPGNKG
ncbi:MAG: radical SAM protein [Actinomycetia bacterium]|nr:radical SAM protein [Actinomycetes bacterium]